MKKISDYDCPVIGISRIAKVDKEATVNAFSYSYLCKFHTFVYAMQTKYKKCYIGNDHFLLKLIRKLNKISESKIDKNSIYKVAKTKKDNKFKVKAITSNYSERQ